MAAAGSQLHDRPKLARIALGGFRSIEQQTIDFDDRTILIGANGAGKSNLIDFLRMLGFMLRSEHGLATFASLYGPASALFHDGPKRTPQIEAHLTVATQRGLNEYRFRLGFGANESLIFLEEQCRFSASDHPGPNRRWIELGAGHRSPQLLVLPAATNRLTQRTILALLRDLHVYQFHYTSREAKIKQGWSVDQNRFLRGDGANIAPFLLRLREEYAPYYRRIVETIRLIAPFFDDFVLEPQDGQVSLRWHELGSEFEFAAHQASDGTLRSICLITLLLQSRETLPPVVVIDEPELGLHPFALRIITGLIKAVSESCQCILATQSPALLDEFDPENVLVVERAGRSSIFRRPPKADLQIWLNDYSLGELWNMNVLGGRPGRAAAE
jgi:predicted ATPase